MFNSNYRFDWHNKIKNILDTIGLSDKWTRQNFPDKKWLSSTVELKLKDQFKQKWQYDMSLSSKGSMCSNFKTFFGF